MFGQVPNNNSNEKNVNTKIRTMYGDLSCLQLSYWNDSISLKINPLSGVSPEGIRQYDYTRRVSTALKQDKCIALANKITEKILPLVKSGEKIEKPVNVGVQVGNKNTAIFVEYKNDDKEVPSLYLTMYTNIGPDGKAPKDSIYSYKFSKTVITEDYDCETGTGKDIAVESEFMFFFNKLSSISDVYGTAAHSINSENTNKYVGQSNKGTFNSQGNYNQQPTSSYSAPVSTFDSSDFPLS